MVLNAGSFGLVQSDGTELANRGHDAHDDDDSDHEDADQVNNGGECIANETIVGPVCVEIDDVIPLLQDIEN